MKAVAMAIVTIVVCFVLWMLFFEQVANSDMPIWLKYLLVK